MIFRIVLIFALVGISLSVIDEAFAFNFERLTSINIGARDIHYDSFDITPGAPPGDTIYGSPRDESGAPHKSGKGNQENHRFYFGNVVEQPIFTTTNTTIFIENGQATDRYVPVYIDGYHFATIDIGTMPEGTPHNESIGFGGQRVDIPFNVYYTVTKEGQLLHHGEGYQHVKYDLRGLKSFYDATNDDIIMDKLPEFNYAKEMQKASWLRIQNIS